MGEHPTGSPRGHLYQPVQALTHHRRRQNPSPAHPLLKSHQFPESHSIQDRIYFLGHKFSTYYRHTYVIALLWDRRANARIGRDARSQPAACSGLGERHPFGGLLQRHFRLFITLVS